MSNTKVVRGAPSRRAAAVLWACLFWPGGACAQTTQKPDLTRQPTLYVVGYAHLDTEWRWEYPQVINEYIRKTMEDNFKLIDKYPHYVFNFSGSNRYRFMKEYFPADFAKVKALRGFRQMVPGRVLGGRGRRERTQRRGDHPADPVREQLVSKGTRQGQRGVHAARLLRISRPPCRPSWRTPACWASPRKSWFGGPRPRAAARNPSRRLPKARRSTWASGSARMAKAVLAGTESRQTIAAASTPTLATAASRASQHRTRRDSHEAAAAAREIASPGAGRTAVRSPGYPGIQHPAESGARSRQSGPGSAPGPLSGRLGCPRRA